MLVVTNVRTAQTLELDIPIETLLPQDSGAREAAQVQFDLVDIAQAFDLLPEDELTISTVEDPAVILVTINVRLLTTDVETIGRIYRVSGYDSSTLLDRVNVVQDDRPAGESDHDRLAYLMTTYGTAVGLDDDPAGIATLNASMPAQKFRLLSLRQAIELVLGTALITGTYKLSSVKKLVTWDTASGLDAAPYDVVVGTPGVGEMAPENLDIKADTSNLFNAYWVRGATAAGSGWQTDPASIAQWGRREKYIDAPDSDLAWKAFNVGQAALADTAQPLYRGTFTAYSPFDGWRSNQRFALTSPMHDLVAAPFDTVRVTPRFLSGDAQQAYDIEFGSPKASFTAKHGKNARRSDGVGPGSGGWGPGGGSGGWDDNRQSGGLGDCNCPPWFDACTPSRETFDRTISPGSLGYNEFNGILWGPLVGGFFGSVNGSEAVLAPVGNGISSISTHFATAIGPQGFPIHYRWKFKVSASVDYSSGWLWIGNAASTSGAFPGFWHVLLALNYYPGAPTTARMDALANLTGSSWGGFTSNPFSGVDVLGLDLWGELLLEETGTMSVRMWIDGGSIPAYVVYAHSLSPGDLDASDIVMELAASTDVGSSDTPVWLSDRIEFVCELAPVSGQIVLDEFVALGDGVRQSYFLLHPYVPNSVRLELDGVPQTVIQINPTTGEIGLTFPPAQGETLRAAEYQAA